MLGFLKVYLRGMRIMMFQLSSFCCRACDLESYRLPTRVSSRVAYGGWRDENRPSFFE